MDTLLQEVAGEIEVSIMPEGADPGDFEPMFFLSPAEALGLAEKLTYTANKMLNEE